MVDISLDCGHSVLSAKETPSYLKTHTHIPPCTHKCINTHMHTVIHVHTYTCKHTSCVYFMYVYLHTNEHLYIRIYGYII